MEFTIKNLKRFDVVDVYVESVKEEGRGVVCRTFTSGGTHGARVVGVLSSGEPFDIGIKKDSALRFVHVVPRGTMGE